MHLPGFLVTAALALQSSNGRTYGARIDAARTERDLSEAYEDLIARVPLGSRLFADSNPVRTAGPMQVSIAFAEQQVRERPYPWPQEGSVRHQVFSRRGGIYLGAAHLLDYSAPHDRPLFRLADFNAGRWASRNAAFQAAVAQISGETVRSITGTMPNGNRYESALERDFMTLLAFDATVDVYTPQPVVVHYIDAEGVKRRYTPDGLVEWRTDVDVDDLRPVLTEIKFREEFAGNWRAWRVKARAAQAFARERGWHYKIFTEREIRTPVLENATFLLQYQSRPSSPETEEWVLNRLHTLSESTPADLIASLYRDRWNQATLIPVLWRLMAERSVGFDVSQPLTMNSPIWSNRG